MSACATCLYWEEQFEAQSDVRRPGKCRRYPPVNQQADQPYTNYDDWCGDYEHYVQSRNRTRRT